MAQYQHLPIYKQTYDVLMRVMVATKDFPREYKYTLGQRLKDELDDLDLSEEQIRKIILSRPKILSSNPQTILSNIDTLAHNMKSERKIVAQSAYKFSPLFYLDPTTIALRQKNISSQLDIPTEILYAAYLRSPTLFSRTSEPFIKKIRLTQRIARICGENPSFSDIITSTPAVGSYSVDRLLIRYLVAKLGLWTWRWPNLIFLSNDKCKKKFNEYMDGLDHADKYKLSIMIARRS
jgi:hypothetical protein